jgi:tetratricopeptide (TPR) repeat protein
LTLSALLVVQGTFAQEKGDPAVSGTVNAKPPRVPQTYALIVGVSNYHYMKKLAYAEKDARAFEAYLKSKSGGNVPSQNIKSFYGDSATNDYVWPGGVSFFTSRLNRWGKGDRFFIYFSGHGGTLSNADNEQKPTPYFFGVDAGQADNGNNINIVQIKKLAEQAVQQGVLVYFIFDACRTTEVGVTGGIKEVNQAIQHSTGEIVLTASQGGKPAYELPSKRHGAFTYLLLRALLGAADGAINGESKDYKITGEEFELFISNNLPAVLKLDSLGKQSPFFQWGETNNTGDMKDRVHFIVDPIEGPQLLAKLDDVQSGGLLYASAKGGEDKLIEILKAKFRKAITDGDINKPAGDCALAYYLQFAKNRNAKSEEIAEMRQELGLSLLKEPRKVLNEDLSGFRNYLQKPSTIDISANKGHDKDAKSRSERKKNMAGPTVNFSYYADPLADLSDYLKIIPAEEQNPSINPLRAYINARHVTIQGSAKKSREKALDILSKSITANPNLAYLHFAKGELLIRMEQLDLGYASVLEASRINPLWTYPYVTLLAMPGLTEEKRTEYMAVLGKASTDFLAQVQIGNYWFNESVHDSAAYYLNKAVRLNPLSGATWNSLGDAYYFQEKYDSAILSFERAVRLQPSKEYFYNLGSSYYQMLSCAGQEVPF